MGCRFVLLMMLVTPAWACSCGGTWPSAKQAWENAPVVFLGTVETADPDGGVGQMVFKEQFVRIRVDEAFKGAVAGQTIELHQGANDCASKFRTGQRAVFYFHEKWRLAACTRSMGNAALGGDDMLFLRGLPKSAKGTRLSGEVELYEDLPQESFHRAGGVTDVHVTVSGPGGSKFEAVTNADGAYEFYNLPPGRYTASIAVPRGLKIKFPFVTGAPDVRGNEAAVDLPANGGVSVSFVLKADTRLTGRMLDKSGNPINDVCIDLEPVEGRSENGARFFDCSKNGGTFKMDMVPPGKYWLVAHDELNMGNFKSKSTLYYPGVRDSDHAEIITVEAGKYADHLDIHLPSNERRFRIEGRMQFNDGSPVAHASVFFTSTHGEYKETTETSEDGSFGFLVTAGMEGTLRGELGVLTSSVRSCPWFEVARHITAMFGAAETESLPLSINAKQANLHLELPFASCKAVASIRR
jgi:hypothetical protein